MYEDNDLEYDADYAFVQCPICHTTASRDEGCHIEACKHLEVVWTHDSDSEGGIGFCGDEPEFSHYITYSIVQLNHALVLLRSRIWDGEPPAESSIAKDRLRQALNALELKSKKDAPAWFEAFKVEGLADDREYRDCFSELFCEVCMDCYGHRMTRDSIGGKTWFALWSTKTNRPKAKRKEPPSRPGRTVVATNYCYESESDEWKCMSSRLDTYAEQVRATLDRIYGTQSWDAVDDDLFLHL